MTSKALEAAKEEAHSMLELMEDEDIFTDYNKRVLFVDALVGQIIRAYAENITDEMMEAAYKVEVHIRASIKTAILKGLEP